jgi:hypothetical protein
MLSFVFRREKWGQARIFTCLSAENARQSPFFAYACFAPR